MQPRVPRVHPQQALAVYAEPLAAGRRVVVFADPASGLLERLEDLGAETVVLLTPDDDLGELRSARFDLAIVADLGLFADPATLLGCVRRLLGETGTALVAAPNREPGEAPDTGALDYYALFDLVAREFADVRMIAQLPFHGVALAEVGDEDESPAVSVDTQLADADRAPDAFVALASQRGTSLDPYAIVQLPAPLAPEAVVDRGELDGILVQLDEARARLDETRTQLVEARAQLGDARAQSGEMRALLGEAAAQVVDGQSQLDATRLELQQTRLQLEEERHRVQSLMPLKAQAARAIELEQVLASRARQLADLSSEVEEMRSAAEAGRIAAAQVEELAKRADRAERARSQAEPELARVVDAHAVELLAFEELLRERARAVRHLEVEVARRERMVRELVGALEEQAASPQVASPQVASPQVATATPAAPAREPVRDAGTEEALTAENAALRARLDALALELARREGDAQAAAWTVAELERRLAAASAPRSGEAGDAVAPSAPSSKDAPSLAPRLAAALDELDALRHALTQEHAARARAESGEELAQARAEISRQAALLEQLGQKLALEGRGGEELR